MGRKAETPHIGDSDLPVWIKLERGPSGYAYADKIYEIIGDLVLDNASKEQGDAWGLDVKGYQNSRFRKFPQSQGKAIQGSLSIDSYGDEGASFWVMGQNLEEAYSRR